MFELAVTPLGYDHFWPGISSPTCTKKVKRKGKAIPLSLWTGALGFQKVEAPRFQDSRHMKVVSVSALRTGPVGGIYYFNIMTPKS
jgi:hypothetical protein